MVGGSVMPCFQGSYRSGYGDVLDACVLCNTVRGTGSTTITIGATTEQDCTGARTIGQSGGNCRLQQQQGQHQQLVRN